MQKIHIFVSDNMLLLQSNGQEKSFLLKKQECMDRICKLGLLSVIVGVLYSCSSDSAYDSDKAGKVKLAQYEAAFTGKYGAIAPDQNWEFGGATTRASYPNNNEWGSFVEVPSSADLTSEKINKIVQLFKDPSKADVIESVNWSDFFVQHVFYGDNTKDMDRLAVHKPNNGTAEDIYNFNKTVGSIMFMYDSGTSSFSYLGNGNRRYDKHIIIFYEGDYYVGLDYEGYLNENTPPDGDYSDWIVRIAPAKYKNAQRIMAEDLTMDGGDFDFNDVVFDAVTVNGATVVTLQAAGGTMPLYIEDNEIHELFGVPQSTMVNTYDKQAKAPVIFRLKKGYSNIKDIPIRVNDVILPAEIGKAPGKLCCPTTCEWTDERQNIETKYPNFQMAVKNGNVNWWE